MESSDRTGDQRDAESRAFHRAEDAEERGEGICRTCLAPIWNEGGTIGRQHRDDGWSDRIGGDSLVCFRAVDYRHVPLTGREACIYDKAYQRGASDVPHLERQIREGIADEIEADLAAVNWAPTFRNGMEWAALIARHGIAAAGDIVRGQSS